MFKRLAKAKLLVAAASFTCTAYSQELPPVTIPANTQLCESQPWKLVLYDDFSGTSLNSNLWSPYNTTWGVDHHSDNWGDGRIPYPDNYSIIRDENIEVSSGRVRLKSIQKSGSWACDTCIHYHPEDNIYVQSHPYTANYTTGYISSKQYFSSGRLEARLKMPIFPHSWNTCWFWGVGGVNEIDFAESKSPIGYPVAVPFPDLLDAFRPSVTYSVHAWAPKHNPDSLKHESQTEWYPEQSAWHWITFRRFKYDEMHTYRCDWDSTRVSFYVDGNPVKTYYKYTETVNIPLFPGAPPGYGGPSVSVQVPVTSCVLPITKTLKILKGFPYNKRSTARLIFSTGVTSREKMLPNFDNMPLGQMEIDYVKVFQRRPEEDSNLNLCSPPAGGISGPDIFCPGAAYTLPAGVSGGQWSVFYGDMFNTPVTGGNTVMPALNVNSNNYYAHLIYDYTVPGCPYPLTVGKQIYTGMPTQANSRAICTRSSFMSTQHFTFHIQNPNPNFQYNWDVSVQFLDLPGGTMTFTGTGASFTTPVIPHTERRYRATWTLNVTSAICGESKTFTGSSIRFFDEYINLDLPVWTEHATFMAKDSSAFYFEAQFSGSDSVKYENAVIARLTNSVLNSPEDTQRVDSLIQKVRTDLLVAYLKFGDIEDGDNAPMMAKLQIKEAESRSSVFPNPAGNNITVHLSKAFDQKDNISYRVVNYAGEIVAQSILSAAVNLEALSPGIYTLILQQGNTEEACKFIKK